MSAALSTDPNVVSIVVGNQSLSGWQDVRITCGVEECPSTFELTLTERYPTQPTEIFIKPGDPCSVMLGSDTVVTGYVDRYSASIAPDKHEVRITGRGMCQDLVDCSAQTQGFQVNNFDIVSFAKKLCQPFGVTVQAPDGTGRNIPQFNIILTETPYEIIERIARWDNFLVYENGSGNLVIARLGDTTMASGLVQGQNVQAAEVTFSTDNRYTEIDPVFLSTAFLQDPPAMPGAAPGPVLPFITGTQAYDKSFPARADGQPRKRPLIIVSEQNQNVPAIAAARAQWDMARRWGRSQQARVTVDSWRDAAGTLWQPNALVAVDLPACKLSNVTWLLSHVTYSRNSDSGTTAELVLMPPQAFVPSADFLVPFDWQVGQEVKGGSTNFGPAAR